MNGDSRPNRWKGFVLGSLASVAGLLAMRFYWQHVATLIAADESEDNSRPPDFLQGLDDISLVGKQYREDESSTAALGRILYTQIAGTEPETEETKTTLSYLVHWYYGLLQGGLYGALSGHSGGLGSGLIYATALWFFGDEMVVPLLGLQGGPSSVSLKEHLNRLGSHLFYGLGTAITMRILRFLL